MTYFSSRSRAPLARVGFLWAVAAFAAATTSFAATPDTSVAAATNDTVRICAAKNALPFSSENGTGFENRIATALGAAMGKEVKTVWLDKPAIYLVRDSLDKNLCDVVVGLDTGDPRVLSTKPYYRTGYVFITRADRNLDISSWNDKRLLGLNHFAVSFDSPGEEMLKQIGKYDENLSYNFSLVNFKSRRNQYVQIDPARMVAEVASGNADIAIAFAPEVARYVKGSAVPLRMTLITDDAVRSDKQKVPQQFNQSAGVRKDDPALLAQLDAALAKAQPEIHGILDAEGIPLATTTDAGREKHVAAK
jgi:mxaJ protein